MELIYNFLIWISSGIYSLASFAFEIFLILASGNFLQEISYGEILGNFYLIIGIIMLFMISFALLRGMINVNDEKKGGTSVVKKVVINLITSGIIIAVLPIVFDFAFDFQNAFIERYNVIGRFFGYGSLDIDNNTEGPAEGKGFNQIKKGSYQIVNGIFTAFINVNPNNIEECGPNVDLKYCQGVFMSTKTKKIDGNDSTISFADAMKYAETTGDFSIYSLFSDQMPEKVSNNVIVAIIAGLVLLYVGVSYCFDMGLRLVKLIFYQIIAPIPVFMRIIPDTKFSATFNNWLKVTLTTYLEVFVRLIIFYFCVYLCVSIHESNFFSSEIYKYGTFVGLFAQAFVLMGIIAFMRQAPKLFSSITGLDSGNMKLGIKDKLKEGGFFTAGAIAGGGLTTMTRNAVNAGKNIKSNWSKTDGIIGKSGLLLKGVGSTLAGGVSGAVRSGSAGWKAGNLNDMKNAANSGANGAISARIARSSRAQRYKASGMSSVEGYVSDAALSVRDWATGGAAQYNASIASADAIVSAYSNVESEAKKLLSKYGNNVSLKAHMEEEDFKGEGSERLYKLYKKYDNMSFSAIEAQLESLKNQDPKASIDRERFFDSNSYSAALTSAIKSVNKEDYFDSNAYNTALMEARNHAAYSVNKEDYFDSERYKKALSIVNGDTSKIDKSSYYDENSYSAAVEAAKEAVNVDKSRFYDENKYLSAIDIAKQAVDKNDYYDDDAYSSAVSQAENLYTQELGDLESMIGQLRKKTLTGIIQNGIVSAHSKKGTKESVWGGITQTDLTGLVTAADEMKTKFRIEEGNSITDPVSGKTITATDFEYTRGDFGQKLKDASDYAKNVSNEAKRLSSKIRLEAEQRNKDSKK